MTDQRVVLAKATAILFSLIAAQSAFIGEATADDASAQITAGYNAASKATSEIVSHANPIQRFVFQNHSLEILKPADSVTFQELSPPGGKMFAFTGKEHANHKPSVFNVCIFCASPDEPLPSEKGMIDAMLNPYRTHLVGYSEHPAETFTANGKIFQGMYFSGAYIDFTSAAGFVFVNRTNDAMFVLFAHDTKPFADATLPMLLKSAKSCKILK